jgi:hypothetical protein
MEDYPRNLGEFSARFSRDEDCREYLRQLRGPEEDLPGRLNLDKTLVVVAAEEDDSGIGRIRMQQIPNASSASLIPSVKESVTSGNVVYTGWLAGLFTSGEQELPTSDHLLEGKTGHCFRTAASGPLGDLATETMVDGNASGRGQSQTPGL